MATITQGQITSIVVVSLLIGICVGCCWCGWRLLKKLGRTCFGTHEPVVHIVEAVPVVEYSYDFMINKRIASIRTDTSLRVKIQSERYQDDFKARVKGLGHNHQIQVLKGEQLTGELFRGWQTNALDTWVFFWELNGGQSKESAFAKEKGHFYVNWNEWKVISINDPSSNLPTLNL